MNIHIELLVTLCDNIACSAQYTQQMYMSTLPEGWSQSGLKHYCPHHTKVNELNKKETT